MDSIALLTGLLEQYSPSGEEGRACAYLVAALSDLGYQAEIDPVGNAVGVLGSGPREILLLGHIDTVPGEIPVRREEDVLHGRGAVDAKGPLACFAAAGARAGEHPGWRVRVVGAVGEESDSRGARYLVQHNSAPEMTIIGEPNRWDHIGLGYKGSLWLRYRVQQPLAHTASARSSACEQAVQFWNRISTLAASYNAPYSRVFDQIAPTLREMQSGSDGFFETASLTVNVRLPLEVSPEELLVQLTALSGSGELTLLEGIPAFRAEKNTSLVRALLASIRQEGGRPGFTLKTGTADMNLVGPAWGCPIIAYGPGDSALDHTPEEQIQVAEYEKSIAVLSGALLSLMEAHPMTPGDRSPTLTEIVKQGKKQTKPDGPSG